MTSQDDVEAFLCTFEKRNAEGQAWSKDRWAALVAQLLAVDSQNAYFYLAAEDAEDYDKIKAEILQCLGVTTSVRVQQGHVLRQMDPPAPKRMT